MGISRHWSLVRVAVGTLATALVLGGCGSGQGPSALTATNSVEPPSTTSAPRSSHPVPTYVHPPDSEATFVRKYLDAVVAGRCAVARALMVSPAVPDTNGRPYADAQRGNGLCGLSRVGQIRINGWRWGDPERSGMGTTVFTVPVILHVTSGPVPPATAWTAFPVPPGWSAYQLPLYSDMNGRLYVTGPPTR